MAEPTDQEIADFEGLLRLRLEQVDGVEKAIQKNLASKRAAKTEEELLLRLDLQQILLGTNGLAFKAGPSGGVIDTSKFPRNRRARTAALVRIDATRKRLEAACLPRQARAPAGVPA